MNIRNVTITSKNQITLPSEYVKELQLNRNRVLQVEQVEGKIILTPQVPLEKKMRQFWSKHNASQAVTDDELKKAARRIGAAKYTG